MSCFNFVKSALILNNACLFWLVWIENDGFKVLIFLNCQSYSFRVKELLIYINVVSDETEHGLIVNVLLFTQILW